MKPKYSTAVRNAEALLATCLIVFGILAPRFAVELRAQGQATSATLSGTVVDKTGAAIAGAATTLKAVDTPFTRSFTTRDDGRFVFTLVPAGVYVLTVEQTGFRPYEQRGITLGLAESANQVVTLEIGSATEKVTVEGVAPLLNTTNANIDSDVTARQVVELPLNWRNVYQLTTLDSSVQDSNVHQVAGVGTNSGNAEQDGGLLNFGGGRFGTTAFLLDGHWDSAGDWDGIIYAPSVDEVQEFKIQSYAFTAQYGWATGNFVNAITKSGTNGFHGSAYEFARDSALDSNGFFNGVNGIPKADFRRNQYGFTVGGPVNIPHVYNGKNKTYFFGAFEILRQANPFTLQTTIPTAAFRNGDFSALLGSPSGTDALGRTITAGAIYNPFTTRTITAGQLDPTTGLVATQSGTIRDPFPGNLIPTNMFDPVAQNLIPFWPQPTNGGVANNYAAFAALPVRSTRYTVKIDHNISDKSHFFARYSQEWLVRDQSGAFFGPDNPGGPGTTTPNNRWDVGFNYTRTFNPTLLMSVTGGWNRWIEVFNPQGNGFQPSTLGLPTSLDANKVFPTISFTDLFGLGGGGASFDPREDRTVGLDVTKVRGNHIFTSGFMGVMLTTNDGGTPATTFPFSPSMTSGPDPIAGNTITGNGLASFLLGAGANGGTFNYNASAAISKKYLGWYFQDDWKATRKLTLNLGLRYEIQTAPTDRYDRLSSFDPNAANPLSQAVGFTVPGQLDYVGGHSSRGVYNTPYNNIAPRIGAAYQILDKLVFRGGFGIYFVPAIEQGDYQGLDLYGFSQATGWVATLDGITPNNLSSNPYPNGLIAPVGKANGALTNVGQSIEGVFRNHPTPYVEQWTAGFQYAPTNNDNIDITYIGNHGVKLIYGNSAGAVQADQLPPSAFSQGSALLNQVTNPFFGSITNSACGLDQPTVIAAQLLRPFPQYCAVSDVQQPSGSSWYDAARINYTHRLNHGLQLLASFTVSKFLDQSSGPESWATRGGTTILNNYNLAGEKSLDTNDIPKSLVLSYIYELPVGRGKKFGAGMNRGLNAVLGGWQVSGISTFKSGFPLAIEDSINNNASVFGGGQRPNVVGDPNQGSCPGGIPVHTLNCWFNTSAFAQPAPFTYGNGPRTMSNVRGQGINNWDLAAQKWFTIRERVRIQVRTEFYNAFNHVYLFAPDTFFGDPAFGTIQNAGPMRSIQFGIKGYW
jgi:Carboxypeptidase regulatory-like domain